MLLILTNRFSSIDLLSFQRVAHTLRVDCSDTVLVRLPLLHCVITEGGGVSIHLTNLDPRLFSSHAPLDDETGHLLTSIVSWHFPLHCNAFATTFQKIHFALRGFGTVWRAREGHLESYSI